MFSFANMASKTKLPEMDAVLLPHSEKEVKRIIKVLGKTKNRMLLREQATECNFKEAARDYTILHFATHFQVNDNQPLYAKLLFARDKNASEDGYLQTYEVMKMRLNAEMAVLSACNTGLGRLKRGEGLTGISRAFFQAGVPSVVVSLWNVDDASTATIMSDFYRYLRSGMDKRKALRCAKLNYMKKTGGEQSDPFYWAPFILLGDPKPLSLPVQPTSSSWKIFVLGLVIILLAIWIWRKPY